MSSDKRPPTDGSEEGSNEPDDVGARLSEGVEEALEEFDRRMIDLLSWILETETRARIYVYLRQQPRQTSEEIATGTGLYPSTVREAIVELHDEEIVTRKKRASGGAGNNPYEYEAISPSELVKKVSDRVQSELNAVLRLDEHLGCGEGEPTGEAVTIEIEAPPDDES